MAYGTVKVDNITFDNGGSDQNVTVSGLYRATTSGVTLSGTIAATTVSGVTVIGSTTVSGATVTGTTANFTSGNFGNIISSAATMSGALIMANQQQVRFREAVGNGVNHIALQAPAIVSADQTITLPDQTGTVITTGDNGSVSSTMLATNLTISAAAGSATTPSIAFTGDLNTGIYSPGADQVAVATNGTGRLFVDASGNVGVGTASQNANLHIAGPTAPLLKIGDFDNSRTINSEIRLNRAGGVDPFAKLSFYNGSASTAEAQIYKNSVGLAILSDVQIFLSAASSEYMRIDSSGRVGIGTSSPATLLQVGSGTNSLGVSTFFNSYSTSETGKILFRSNNNFNATLGIASIYASDAGTTNQNRGNLIFATGFDAAPTERLRIDSSGRLLVGTSTGTNNLRLDQKISTVSFNNYGGASLTSYTGASGIVRPVLDFQKSRGTTDGSFTAVAADDLLGTIVFRGADGSAWQDSAYISAQVDGTPGANDMPGRLVFSTTADGSSTPTERMRITSIGEVVMTSSMNRTFGGNTVAAYAYDAGTGLPAAGQIVISCKGNDGAGGPNGVGLTRAATSWAAYSDERAKADLVPIDDGLSKVSTLRSVTGRYLDDEFGTSRSFLIAQDVQAVLPEAVDAGDPDKLSLRYTEVIPLLVAALKESKERIETLEAAVAALQGA